METAGKALAGDVGAVERLCAYELRDVAVFHGWLSEDKANERLPMQGDWLVRLEPERAALVISANQYNRLHDVVLRSDGGNRQFHVAADAAFDNLAQLFAHLVNAGRVNNLELVRAVPNLYQASMAPLINALLPFYHLELPEKHLKHVLSRSGAYLLVGDVAQNKVHLFYNTRGMIERRFASAGLRTGRLSIFDAMYDNFDEVLNAHKKLLKHPITRIKLRIGAQPFNHVGLSESHAAALLQNTGDFLVYADVADYTLRLAVRWRGVAYHLRIDRGQYGSFHRYSITEGRTFADPGDLIRYHFIDKVPVHPDGVLLLCPVEKDKPGRQWRIPLDLLQLDTQLPGSVESVFYGQLKKGDERTACIAKKFALGRRTDASLDEIVKDARRLCELEHANLVGHHGVAFDKTQLVLVGLTMATSLSQWLRDSSKDARAKQRACAGVANALAYLHSRQYVHGKLSGHNCFIKNGVVKVTDSCLAGFLVKHWGSHRFAADPRWSAPEVVKTGKTSQAGDVWSLGVVVWFVWSSGRVPNADELQEPPKDTDAPELIGQLIAACLRQPAERLTAADFLVRLPKRTVTNKRKAE